MGSPAKHTYHDTLIDRLLIGLISRQIARTLGSQTPFKGYVGFVDLSRQIMQGRNALEQQAVVAVVLRSLVPSPVLTAIRTLFTPTRRVCELNAWFATRLFEWLVGPCDLQTVEVKGTTGQSQLQTSGVHIQKCRYLEQSGCVGMCLNLCKLPTQKFFTQDFGIPLTLTPNFEDFSCEMVFGQEPPDFTTEAAYQQGCLSTCTLSATHRPTCPTVRD
ncbi:DUF4033 domain-containing protein [Synechococcales cyanobacterium C]|uniref:DUF4033 domain-containing protein n=2 Tax=Petrachloros TaxID=2918834 RepID=A0A8K2A7N1_9CYAN|nr:DUF4033 domain-containing protein [Petrachloros mirabilis]NCJ07099.1 DUF4033 domain-containing protein [Petrachloros mirabilis ULC683]